MKRIDLMDALMFVGMAACGAGAGIRWGYGIGILVGGILAYLTGYTLLIKWRSK